jgi:hypothetical protein
MKTKLGSEEKVKEVLRTYLIDESAFNAMKNDNYKEFLVEREKTLNKEIDSKILSF